jgi:hypothetical protein
MKYEIISRLTKTDMHYMIQETSSGEIVETFDNMADAADFLETLKNIEDAAPRMLTLLTELEPFIKASKAPKHLIDELNVILNYKL